MNFLGQLRHPNLVKLIGYCCEDDHRLLVYEFMFRGSLENHLFRSMHFFAFCSSSIVVFTSRNLLLQYVREGTANSAVDYLKEVLVERSYARQDLLHAETLARLDLRG